MKYLALSLLFALPGLPAGAVTPRAPHGDPGCNNAANGLEVCRDPAEAGLVRNPLAHHASYTEDLKKLDGQVTTNAGNCDRASAEATRIGNARGQTANPAEHAAMITRTSGVLRECRRVMGEIAGGYRSRATAADEQLRKVPAGDTACKKAIRNLYSCMKTEAGGKAAATDGKGNEYGTAANTIDPAGAEAERRARRMGGDDRRAGKPGGGPENTPGGGPGGDQKKEGGQQGGGGDPSGAMKAAEQAMQAAQQQKQKEEAERKAEEARQKAEEQRQKQIAIQECNDKKSRLMAALQQCDWKFNLSGPVQVPENVKNNEDCKARERSMSTVSEVTNCSLAQP